MKSDNQLWRRNFSLYTFGVLFSVTGNSVSILALSFLIFKTTGSTTSIAIVFAITALMSLFGPLVGKIIDRVNVRRLLSCVDFFRALVLILFVTSVEIAGLSEPLIYGFAAVNAFFGLIYRPSTGSFMPALVGVKNLVKANSVMAMIFNIAGIGGYFFAGVLISQIGAKNALLVDALTFLIMGTVFIFIRETDLFVPEKPESEISAGAENASQITNVVLLRMMARTGIIMVPAMIVLTGLAVAPFQVEWPRLVSGMGGGVLFALISCGAIVSSAIIYWGGNKIMRMEFLCVSLAIMSLTVLVPVMFQGQVLLMIVGFFLGVFTSFSSSVTYSSLQILMPAGMRGRIFGLMEPMEKLPMVGVFVLIGWLGANFSVWVTFSVIFALTLLGAVLIVSIMFKTQVFENAKLAVAQKSV